MSTDSLSVRCDEKVCPNDEVSPPCRPRLWVGHLVAVPVPRHPVHPRLRVADRRDRQDRSRNDGAREQEAPAGAARDNGFGWNRSAEPVGDYEARDPSQAPSMSMS